MSDGGTDRPGTSDRTTVRRVGLAVLVANLVLVAAKGAVYWTTGSLAVGSEAVNSLSDSAYSLVVVAGLYLTTRPPDFEHPHGHERIEPFVSLFVAAGVFLAGGLVLWRSVTTVLSGAAGAGVAVGPAAVAVLVGTAVVKYALYRYCRRKGERANSPALVATGKDSRNDVLTAGAALIGVAGAWAGYPILDPLAAGAVSLSILYTGVEIVRDNVDYLVGAAPPEDLRAEIVDRALAHPDVEGVHDVVAHYVGPEIDVSLHVEVEGRHTLFEAHEIETDVMDAIRDLSEVDDVFVHVDPKELGEWKSEDDAAWVVDGADDDRDDGDRGVGSTADPPDRVADAGNRTPDRPDDGDDPPGGTDPVDGD